MEEKITYYSEDLSNNMQKAFEAMRKKGEHCDMLIKTGKKEFSVHKIVIAATSRYFRDLSRRKSQKPLIFDYIGELIMADIIDFCYTSKLNLSADNATEILGAASKFRMVKLVRLCMQYFDEKVSIENYGSVLDTLSRTPLTEIPERTLKLVLNNFEKVAADRHLLKLNADSMDDVLSDDELNVKDEETVLEVVRDWFDVSPRERATSLDTLLDCVRFALIAPEKLLQLRKDKLLLWSDHFLDLVNEAIDFQVSNSDMKRYKGSEKARARLPTHFEPGSWIFIVYGRAILKYDLFHNTYTDITCPDTTAQKIDRTFQGGAIIGDELYIVDDYGAMEIYDILDNEWAKPVENKQFSLHSKVEAVFAAGDFVYIILDLYENSVRFDIRSQTWETLLYYPLRDGMDMYSNIVVGACCLDGEATAIINHWDRLNAANRISKVYKYTQTGWETVRSKGDGYILNAPGKLISFDGKVFSPLGRKLICFNADFKSYQRSPKMTMHRDSDPWNTRRDRANLFEIDGQIVVFGGEPTNTLEKYNTKSGEWSTLRLNAPFGGVVDVVKYVREI